MSVELIEKAAATIERLSTDHAQSVQTIRELNARLSELETKGATIAGNSTSAGRRNAVSHALQESADFQSVLSGRSKTARVPMELELKSLLGSTAFAPAGSPTSTYDVETQRQPGLWGYAQRQIPLLEALPRIPMTSNTLDYIRITYSNVAAIQGSEGGRKAEAGVGTSLESAKAATIAHWLPVSRQVLADAPSLEASLRMLLLHGVQDKAERELINGTASISGLLTEATAYVGAARNRADLIGECASVMGEAGYTPTHIILNPRDWFTVQSRADDNGGYVMGSAAIPLAPSLWNLPVITTAGIAQNSALVIDATKLAILDRQQAAVEIGMTEAQFIENAVTLLAEVRIGLAIFDTGAVRSLSFGGSPTIE